VSHEAQASRYSLPDSNGNCFAELAAALIDYGQGQSIGSLFSIGVQATQVKALLVAGGFAHLNGRGHAVAPVDRGGIVRDLPVGISIGEGGAQAGPVMTQRVGRELRQGEGCIAHGSRTGRHHRC